MDESLSRITGVVLALVLSTAVGLAAGGCRDATHEAEAVPAPVDPSRAFVEHLLADLDEQLRRRAEAVATADALQSHLSREAARSWNARVDGGIKYADLFERLYAEGDHHKVFARSDGLNRRGEAVLQVLLDAERHALDAAPYHVARIQTLVAELVRMTADEPRWQGEQLSAEEVDRLVAWLDEHQLDPRDRRTEQRVIGALVGDEAGPDAGGLSSPVPRVTERMERFLQAFEQTAEQTAELELRLADGALRYARDIKHFNLARQDWRDLRDAGGSKALIYGRLEQTYEDLRRATPQEAGRVLTALAPAHPQYAKLLDARARYRGIAAGGGWQRVRKTSLELGARSPRVESLRERLAAEGYLSPAPAERVRRPGAQPRRPDSEREDDALVDPADADAAQAPDVPDEDFDPQRVDEELLEAVKSYQETHQFRPDGEPTSGFWRSLNVPVERRLAQIELTIQRWRESHYDGERDFIMVNIADFHAEVFVDGERQMRFRVVVGKNNRRCDRESGQWVYPNATPIQMAHLDHVIVNPYWYVPQRLIRESIEPKLRSDSDYLEKNNYEQITMGGRETIRQKPGDDNALGRVKFIFPNPDNIYMHDTPKKKYFDYPVRAYSHGCVRVHKPLELAEHLLSRDPEASKYNLDELIESGRQRYVELAQKQPVFIEYYTVRVDDQGRPHFLADIYNHDRVRLADDPEEARECRSRKRPSSQPQTHSQEVPDDIEADLGP
jgi:L,D-transpeptidase YcbB